jgi:hypothetical protein
MGLKVTNFNLNISVSGMSNSSGNFSSFNIFSLSGLNAGAVFNMNSPVRIKKVDCGVQPLNFFTSSTGAINESKTNPFFELEVFFSSNVIPGLLSAPQARVNNGIPPYANTLISPNLSLLEPAPVVLLTHTDPLKEIDLEAGSIFLRRLGVQISKDTTVTDAIVVLNFAIYWEKIC